MATLVDNGIKFIDREEEITSVQNALERGENVLVTGPGGVGKSFLLRHLHKVLEEVGRLVIFQRGIFLNGPNDFFYSVYEWVTKDQEISYDFKEGFFSKLEEIKRTLNYHTGINPQQKDELAQRKFRESFEEMAGLDTEVLLMIDDLDELLNNTRRNFEWFIRDLMQEYRKIQWIVSGRQMEDYISPKAPFYKFFSIIKLKPFTKEVSDIFLSINGEVRDKELMNEFYSLTEGHPGMSALLTGYYKKYRDFVLSSEMLKQVQKQLALTEFRRLTPQQKRIVISLARGIGTPTEIAEDAIIPMGSVGPQLQRLMRDGVIKKEEDRYIIGSKFLKETIVEELESRIK